ncbi:MAG: mechanosensitive ion channel [Planctomycetales bacterium]|nr:mechanosensitive ion channel [Planctomycetales bacterium]
MDETRAQEKSAIEHASTAVDSSEGAGLPTSIVDSVQGLMRGDVSEAASTLVLRAVLPAVVALLMLVVAYFVAKLVARWVSTAMCARVDQTLGRFAGKFSFYTVFIVSALAILQTAGVSITSFAAIMAAAGFAIGLAFQGTLSNFASGILLLVFRPFKVGDVISAAGITGKVNEIDMFTTTFDTPDNRRLIVPNSSIAGTTIENISFHKHRRVDVTVGVAYKASLDATREVLTQVTERLGDRIASGEGRESQIILTNLGASSVEWTVRVWAPAAKFFPVKESLVEGIKRGLDDAGIEIPFPQMHVHLANSASEANAPDEPEQPAAAEVVQHPPEEKRSGRIRPRIRGESRGV